MPSGAMSTEARALQTCGAMVLLFALCLAALGSACLHLAWSYPKEHQDPEISGWLPLVTALGISSFSCGLAFLVGCTCLDACLLSQRGCGGGGTMFRLGLAGICIVPVLFLVSIGIYVCFWRSVFRRWEHRLSAPDQAWFEECRWVAIGGVFTHAIILAFCIRIVALFTCFYKGGVGSSYHEFDNPSFLTMIGRRPSSSLPFYTSYQTQSYLSQSSYGVPYQNRADSVSSLRTPPQSAQTTLRVPGSGRSSYSQRRRSSVGRPHREARQSQQQQQQHREESKDNSNIMRSSLDGKHDHDHDHDHGHEHDHDEGAAVVFSPAEPLVSFDEPEGEPPLEAEG